MTFAVFLHAGTLECVHLYSQDHLRSGSRLLTIEVMVLLFKGNSRGWEDERAYSQAPQTGKLIFHIQQDLKNCCAGKLSSWQH